MCFGDEKVLHASNGEVLYTVCKLFMIAEFSVLNSNYLHMTCFDYFSEPRVASVFGVVRFDLYFLREIAEFASATADVLHVLPQPLVHHLGRRSNGEGNN